MRRTIYASIKARMAGVKLLNTGLLSRLSGAAQLQGAALSNRWSGWQESGHSRFDGQTLFHLNLIYIYRLSPRFPQKLMQCLCSRYYCDCIKEQLRSFERTAGSMVQDQQIETTPFIDHIILKEIATAESISTLAHIISDIFSLSEFEVDPSESTSVVENRIDRLHNEQLADLVCSAPLFSRRQLLRLFRTRDAIQSKRVIDRQGVYRVDQWASSDLGSPFGQFSAVADEGKYLSLLKSSLRYSPLTTVPIIAYVLLLDLFCNRLAGERARIELEPRNGWRVREDAYA